MIFLLGLVIRHKNYSEDLINNLNFLDSSLHKKLTIEIYFYSNVSDVYARKYILLYILSIYILLCT